MSELIYKNGVEGNPSNENNSVDSFFNTLQSASTAVDKTNTRTEWVSTDHIKWSDKPLTRAWVRRENSNNVGTTYAPAAFTTVSHGNNGSTEITGLSHAFGVGDTLRYHFNTITLPNAKGIGAGAIDDYWWLKVEVQYDTGGGPVWNTLGYVTRNSFTQLRNAIGTPYPINGHRRYGISFCKVFPFSGTWTGIRVQTKSESVGMDLILQNWSQDARLIGA